MGQRTISEWWKGSSKEEQDACYEILFLFQYIKPHTDL